MKSKILFFLFFFYSILNFAQSPFNYGQSKAIYFLSSEARDSLGIEEITCVVKLPENDRGGMGENWDVTRISFSQNYITDDWYPISMPKTFKYQLDSLIFEMKFLNGTSYDFVDNILVAFGGGGYGSFDWKDVMRYGDSISIIATSCVGHCGEQPIRFSKNVFNGSGQLIYCVKYPVMEGVNELPEEPLGYKEIDAILVQSISDENKPDTTYYKYNNSGLYVGTNDEIKHEMKSIFVSSSHFNNKEFQQCYIGDIKMEKAISKKIGMLPELLLIEIYRYGVFSFALNPTNKKYYRTGSVELEQ